MDLSRTISRARASQRWLNLCSCLPAAPLKVDIHERGPIIDSHYTWKWEELLKPCLPQFDLPNLN